MLLIPLFFKQFLWVIPVVSMMIGYFFILRKMNINTKYAVLPVVAEWRLSKSLLRYRRSFWRPCIVATVFVAFALYLNPFEGTSTTTAKIYLIVAILVYSAFLLRLYWRLTGTFYTNIIVRLFFTFLTWLLPPLGLLIMAFGKAPYKGEPEFKQIWNPGPVVRFLLRLGFVGLSVAEVFALVAVVGFITLRTYPPRMLGQYMLNEVHERTKDVTGTGRAVSREDTMGEAYAQLETMPTSRDKYFSDHSQDKSVVVMEYIIGADLEDKAGLSSANITQMIEATEKGSALSFVLECGGSGRWFTNGIDDNSYGRYLVHDGKLEKVAELDKKTCMSEQQSLADFINWTRDNYPADRYMLVMWDHGGGLSTGYGVDIINKKQVEGKGMPTLSVAEIASAIAQSGVKFDVIGFDACLMQDLDVAAALEPYADYYLGSEETEGGYGWFYTSAFGNLAANPGMSSEDFGKEMVACYDPYNTAIKDENGEPDTKATLSFVDLRYAKAAFDQMQDLFGSAREAIHEDSSSYANLSFAGTKSYSFDGKEQVDLIDFLEHLEVLDFDNKIYPDEKIDELIRAVKACVIYRNGNAAEGINGMSLAFPCQAISSYNGVYSQLKSFSFDTQRSLYDDFFSIMAAQKQKQAKAAAEEGDVLGAINGALSDYTTAEWYVEGFEDYEPQDAFINIPLTEVENGYRIELPESAWPIIADSQLIVYQKAEDGRLRYLGLEGLGAVDEAGHALVAMDNSWVHVGGSLVCYEDTGYRETDQGVIFTGKTKALLNDTDEVTLKIEWDPVPAGAEGPTRGRVVSYSVNGETDILNFLSTIIEDEETMDAFNSKAEQQLKSGDKLDFLFSYYDEQGNLVNTQTYGKTVNVVKPNSLTVTDEPLDECDVVFGGVLTDVYQRTMTTEKVEAHVTK